MTLKGFKSFANPTTLILEPGITCVVGPNGSGKSNVVDALAWVMGEQGAKSLRGGKMEDVIFAGTSGKAPLGRAEVSLTIDNSDGALPIDFSEVTISRILFRNGQSEYQINGDTARLLDVQELLSDSGIGREMHVIVGQGQLDAILMANPEERRAFIEEAAGVLKHRKRKEKALRKLESMQGNVARIQDLTAELRRQLRPLGKQAEVAKKAATIQADLRDAKLRLLADDIVGLRRVLENESKDENSLRARKSEVDRELGRMRNREVELDQLAATEGPALSAAQDNYYSLTAEREKLRATASLASERAKLLAEDVEEAKITGRDPEALEAEAAVLKVEEEKLREAVKVAASDLTDATSKVSALEKSYRDEESKVSAALRALADLREGSARREGHLTMVESKIASAEDEKSRLLASRASSQERMERSTVSFAALEAELSGLGAGEERLDADYEVARAALENAKAKESELQKRLVEIERDLSSAQSKRDALQQASIHKDGAGALLADPRGIAIKGSVASLLEIEKGWESAVSSALGSLADALVLSDLSSAVKALALLKSENQGRADLLILGESSGGKVSIPATLTSLRSKVSSTILGNAIESLLPNHVVADDLSEAERIIKEYPEIIAVTADGEMISSRLARGGSGNSLIQIAKLIETTEELIGNLSHERDRIKFESNTVKEKREDAERAYEAAKAELNESDSKMASLTESMAGLGQSIKSAKDEIARIDTAISAVEANITKLADELKEAKDALTTAPVSATEPDTSIAESLKSELATARGVEVDARLQLRTTEERVTALVHRIEELIESAKRERESASRQIARREARGRGAVIAQEIAETAYEALIQIEISIAAAAAERERLEISRSDREGETLALRSTIRELAAELETLTSSVHQDEIAKAEQRLRIEQIETRALEEFGLDGQTLVAEYGPENLVPTFIESESGEITQGDEVPFKREAQEKRLAAAERSLTLLGKINPLALEEYSSLEERLKYLADQMEDLKKSRKDLMDIVKEVDDKVLEIFTQAYNDTAKEFEGIFSRLFPGGEGKLILTNPDDMLTTGIDVEARPPGKRIKRLSLLSGGERSLTAVALLIAIFKARPSPFYVMDEVEAALDDTNLGRLLGILAELRASSQLIVITHQKRTMEIADALYGVTMRGDGVSEVISQRIREVQALSS
ncbi:MAG: chromosome segregation protein SMC [Actinobacteria bacterium]|nr:chromosome segregation protein SMC [Actinomycetota bacterium]